MKKTINHVCLWLVIYNVFVLLFGVALAQLDFPLGTESIVATIVGTILVYVFAFRKYPVNIFESKKKMTPLMLFTCFCLFSLFQMLTSVAVWLAEDAGLQGLNIQVELNSTWMLLYAVLLGPIVEELMYRGFVCGVTKSCGKVFAIVFSGICFGIMHMNFEQLLIGSLTGMLLAYMFCEYSIIWPFIIHVFNNLLASVPELFLSGRAAETYQDILSIVLGVFGVIGIVIMIIKGKDIKAYMDNPENQGEEGCVKALFSSVWFWVYIVIFVGAAVLMILFPNSIF